MSRFFLIFAALLAFFPDPHARAFCRMTVEEPMPRDGCPAPGTWLEWRRQCISYTLVDRDADESDFEEVRDAADRSFSRWTAVECDDGPLPIELAQTSDLGLCTTAEYNQRSGNANTIYFVDNWLELGLPFDAFGLTMIWHSPEDGEIFDADMQLNETQGRFTVCDDRCEPGTVDLENVITHEAGHFLGLGHSEVSDATMHSRASTGETSKRTLEADDIEGICHIYGDLDAPDCDVSDFQPDHGFSPECAGPEGALPAKNGLCSIGAPAPTPGVAGGFLLALVLVLARRRSKT
ncbi:MAG: matrixin family metalloprotease [Myxococcales bacterium]|nr:matrixin family metalloprotease [Myxococcales bacterium]